MLPRLRKRFERAGDSQKPAGPGPVSAPKEKRRILEHELKLQTAGLRFLPQPSVKRLPGNTGHQHLANWTYVENHRGMLNLVSPHVPWEHAFRVVLLSIVIASCVESAAALAAIAHFELGSAGARNRLTNRQLASAPSARFISVQSRNQSQESSWRVDLWGKDVFRK